MICLKDSRIISISHLYIVWLQLSSAFQHENCDDPLGMESGLIPDEALSSSSSHSINTHGPQYARLNKNSIGGAWCAKGTVLPDQYEYLEIKFPFPVILTKVATQGRVGLGEGVEFLPQYRIQYLKPTSAAWRTFKNRQGVEVLLGNSESRSVVANQLKPAIIASVVRFVPHLDHGRPVCLRVEVYGCRCSDHLKSSFCEITENTTDITVSTVDSAVNVSTADLDVDQHQEAVSPVFWYIILGAVFLLVLLIIGTCIYIKRKRANASSPIKKYSLVKRVSEFETSQQDRPFLELGSNAVVPSAPLYQTLDPDYNSNKMRASKVHEYETVVMYAEPDILPSHDKQNTRCQEQLKKEEMIEEIGRDDLKFIRNLGKGKFGEVHLCVLARSDTTRIVVVKTLRSSASQITTEEYNEELHFASAFNHKNVVKVLGVCREPQFMAIEYTEMGDLRHFLNKRQFVGSDTYRARDDGRTIGFHELLSFLKQISSGMKYLDSKGYVHRDLATRNCLVDVGLSLKITDVAMARHQEFSREYYIVDKQSLLPIRWMSWEAMYLGNYSNKSDVWSFGVTVWEILTLCKQLPYHQLDDQEVLNLTENRLLPVLHQPLCCPELLYTLLKKCMNKEECDRPNFEQVNSELNKI